MNALITISGNGGGCLITACVEPAMVNMVNGECCIYTSNLPKDVDTLISINSGYEFTFLGYAPASSTRLEVEKPYIWTKHQLVSNVPIKTYCNRGLLGSIVKFVKDKLK